MVKKRVACFDLEVVVKHFGMWLGYGGVWWKTGGSANFSFNKVPVHKEVPQTIAEL